MNARIKGFLVGTAAAATYGLNPLFALPLYADGLDTYSVLLLRYLGAIPLLAIMIKARGRSFAIRRDQFVSVIVLGLMLGLSSLGLFLSYRYIDAGIASTLLIVYPLMVAVIMTVMYHERFTWITGSCLITAGVGLVLLYNGKPGATLDPIGVAWVMTSALSYAIVLVGINRSALASMPSNRMTFYLLLFGSFIFIGPAAIKGTVTIPVDNVLWFNIIALGLLPTAVSLICTAVAIHCIGSTPVALLGVFEPVTAVLCGVLVFSEQLTGRDAAGLVLIMISVMMVIAGGLIRKRSAETEVTIG